MTTRFPLPHTPALAFGFLLKTAVVRDEDSERSG